MPYGGIYSTLHLGNLVLKLCQAASLSLKLTFDLGLTRAHLILTRSSVLSMALPGLDFLLELQAGLRSCGLGNSSF